MGTANPFKDHQPVSLTKKLFPWTIYALLPIALFRLYFYTLPLPPSPETELSHSTTITISAHSDSLPSSSSPPPPHTPSADDKPFVPTYQVSKEKTKGLGIEFIPLHVSLRETVESLREKKFVSF